MAVVFTNDTMALVGRVFCFPVALIINFALFQYLLAFHHKRRRQFLGILLLSSAAVGFLVLIPFAMNNTSAVECLNNISETCTVLTFLVQIIIAGREIGKKLRLPLLQAITRVAELLTVLELVVVGKNVVEIAAPSLDLKAWDVLDNTAENLCLAFIFVSRFAFLILSSGFRRILRSYKLDVVLYLLFVTHEYPFVLLAHETGVSWEMVQAVWHRITITMCIVRTIHTRYKASNATNPMSGTSSKGPSMHVGTDTNATNTPTRLTSSLRGSARQSNRSDRSNREWANASVTIPSARREQHTVVQLMSEVVENE